MDADGVFWADLHGQGVSVLADLTPQAVVELALSYSIWLPVDTYASAPWLAPYAVRRLRIRTDPRAPGPKRDLWGLPDEKGCFTDDNSLIKGVVKDLPVSADSPYGSRRIGTGLVCCHVWPGTTTNPLLFSFVPNLVWLPKSLATYSDAHLEGPPHEAHEALKAVSVRRYREHPPEVGKSRSEAAWQCLPAPAPRTAPCASEFLAGDRVAALARQRTIKMIDFLEASLTNDGRMPNRFSKRYHAGVGPGIDPSVWPIDQAVTVAARLRLISDLKSCVAPSNDGSNLSKYESLRPHDGLEVGTFGPVAANELRLDPVSEAEWPSSAIGLFAREDSARGR